jgi:DNA-binding winged helix-turn-helix (wHTH) protein
MIGHVQCLERGIKKRSFSSDGVLKMAMSRGVKHFYEFGPFRLDISERLLRRDEREVQLPPKVFETLLVFVENGGHILEKEELIRRLWPDSFVEESSLSQNIFLLRKALGEAGGDGQYIETIPRRG